MSEVADAFARGDIWGALERILGSVLAGFYGLIPLYGIAIILLTIAIRLLVWPLASKQARSMMAMQKHQPEIKKLQQKYKSDRQKLNEELMGFYKEKGINPLGGCLPLIVQMPILFALFRVFSAPAGSNHYLDAVGLTARSGEVLCNGAVPRGVHGLIPSGSALRESLDCATQKFLFMDLAKRPSDLIGNWPAVIPYLLLIGLVVATGVYSARQMAKKTPATAQNDQMRLIMQIMPVFFGFITYTLSAGLGVYFLVSNLWQIGQQEMIFKQRQREEANPKKATTPPRQGLFSRLMRPPPARPGTDTPAGTSNGKARGSDASPSRAKGGTPARTGSRSKQEVPVPAREMREVKSSSAKGTSGGSRPADAQRSRKKRRKKSR